MAARHDGTTAPGRDRRFATTLARGLSVLRAFRADDDGLGNAELAARTGLPRSTVSRLTFTLRALGYLEQARGDERYRPGPVLLSLGNVAAGAIPFVDASAPLMQRVADATGTLAVLGVRDAEKLLLVRTWRPRGVASLWLEVGHRLPIVGSSSGQALLGALSDTAFARVLDVLSTSGATLDETTNAASDGTVSGAADEAVDGVVAESADDLSDEARGESPDSRSVRREARRQLRGAGFVVADPRHYFTPNIHAASVPFHASQLAEPVVFTCGAMPEGLSLERLHGEVGPALRAAVDELAVLTGQPGASPRHVPEEIAS